MKKLILTFIVFFVSFCFFTLIFFPYTRVVNYFIHNFSQKNKIKINYEYLNSNFFNTKIKKLTINNFQINTLTINHNIFKFPFNGITIIGKSNGLLGKIKIIKKNLYLVGFLDLSLFKNYINKNVNGKINFNGEINLNILKGDINLQSPQIIYIDKKLGKVYFKNLKGDLFIEKSKILVKKLYSKDLPFQINGYISLNFYHLENSRLNLNGEVKIAGMVQNFKIRGSISNPRIF